jgi:hypothetical protein
MKAYEFQEFYIPERMMSGIKMYVEQGIRPGDFLVSIIQNNLKLAVMLADPENLRNIPAYVAYFHEKCPAACWGSEEKMVEWRKRFE